MVTGMTEGVASLRRERHVLTRAEALDPLQAVDDRVT
jgi:hypothetical protein